MKHSKDLTWLITFISKHTFITNVQVNDIQQDRAKYCESMRKTASDVTSLKSSFPNQFWFCAIFTWLEINFFVREPAGN